MEDDHSIRNLGRAQTFKFVSFGLLTALLMIGGLSLAIGDPFYDMFSLLARIENNLIASFGGLLIGAYYFGAHAADQIIIKSKSPQFVGIYTSILILILGTTCGSLFGLFEQGLIASKVNLYRQVTSYFLTPLVVILIFGFIPTVFLGVFLGKSIKSLGHY